MREIKFRGKVVDDDYRNEKQLEMVGKFVHFTGYLQTPGILETGKNIGYVKQFEEIEGVDSFMIDLETVEQYTGSKDKHGNEIYEGDIIRVNQLTFDSSHPLPENLVVHYYGSMFQLFRGKECLMGLHLLYIEDGEVIGNIQDHAELLTTHS